MIDWIQNNAGSLWIIGSSVVTIASIIVKLTPTQKDDAILAKIIKVLEVFSLNKEKK